LRRLVELISYRPRPATAAHVSLALIAEPTTHAVVPAGTAFRSEAFDDQPPQVFESRFDAAIDTSRNEWSLAPVRERTWDGFVRLDPATSNLFVGALVLFLPRTAPAVPPAVARVRSIARVPLPDGAAYLEPELDTVPSYTSPPALDDIDLLQTSLRCAPTGFKTPAISFDGSTTTTIFLDSIYKQVRSGDWVVLESGPTLGAFRVDSVAEPLVTIMGTTTPPVDTPVTALTITGDLPTQGFGDASKLVIHFRLVPAGRLVRPAKTRIERADFAPGLALERPAARPDTPPTGGLLLRDAAEKGARVAGGVSVDGAGKGTVTLGAGTPAFPQPLEVPVRVHGNVVEATRGETVLDEVLGSGDPTRWRQSFTLRKEPLTYLEDPAAPHGRRSTLEIRVDTILWREVESFFGATREDRVYVVRRDDAGKEVVTFGGGARLPAGVDNVVARYRCGGGAAKPKAGGIRQLARAIAGVRRVVNPVAASGGADADSEEDIRRNAPATALLLGRAISIPDFEALAREFGVLNVSAEWAWDAAFQGAVVKLWVVPDGGDPVTTAADLRATLLAQAEEAAPIVVASAQPLPTTLELDLAFEPGADPETVARRVMDALVGRDGLLSPRHVPIGRPLWRSRLVEAVMAVDGVASVRGLAVDGAPPGIVVPTPAGFYRAFASSLRVNMWTFAAAAA
jgi:predicted phage baseplate assembly protein